MPRPRQPQQPEQPAPPVVDLAAQPTGPAADPVAGPQPQMGEDSWLLFDPEVSGILHAATTGSWEPERLRTALQDTGAYAEVTERRAAFADPVAAGPAREDLTYQVSAMLGRRAPGDPLVAEVVGRLERGETTFGAVRSLVAPMTVGTPAARVLELAGQHGIPMSRQSAEQWTRWGELDVDAQLAALSQQLFPWKPQGVPYQQFAGIFADLHGAELGRQVGATDARLNDLMAASQGDVGRFRQMLRELPEWAETPHARELIAQRTDQVMSHLMSGDLLDETLARQDQTTGAPSAYGHQTAVAGMGPAAAGSATLGPPQVAAPGMMQPDPSSIPATADAGGLVQSAARYLGMPYVWGGESIEEGGFDCSGLVQTAAASLGIKLPRTSAEQAKVGTPVSMAEAQAGDLLFWDDGGRVHHVAIYMGGGKMLAAPHRGAVVRVQDVYGNPFARRIGGAATSAAAAGSLGAPAAGDSGLAGGSVGVADALSGGADFALNQPPAPTGAPVTGLPGGLEAGGDWQGSLSPAERWIIQRESSFNPAAKNPKSSAFGLGQLLLDHRLRYLGADYATTDPHKQLAAFRNYVADRYGTAERAMAFWRANGWY